MRRDSTRRNSRQRWSPRSLSATRLLRSKVCIAPPLRLLTPVRLVRAWSDGQPVDVPPPAVERTDDRADDSPPDLGHEDVGGACGDRPPQVVGGVRYARRGLGLPPEFEDC